MVLVTLGAIGAGGFGATVALAVASPLVLVTAGRALGRHLDACICGALGH